MYVFKTSLLKDQSNLPTNFRRMVRVAFRHTGGDEVGVADRFHLVDVEVAEAVVKLVVQVVQQLHNLKLIEGRP